MVRLAGGGPIKGPRVLYGYLTSSVGQSLLKSRSAGTGVQMVQTGDVKSLPVIVPSPKEQDRILAAQDRILELRRQVAEIKEEIERLTDEPWMG